MAISYIHYPKGSIIGSGPTAYRHYGDETPPYDYGDGSLNMTTTGYNNLLYLNGTKLTSLRTETARYGNCTHVLSNTIGTTIINSVSSFTQQNNVMYCSSTGEAKDTYATNTFVHTAYNGEYTFCYYFHGGTWISSASVKNFKLTVNGSGYTLSECVTNGYIKPLVLTASCANAAGVWTATQLCWRDIMKIYDNSGPTRNERTSDGRFPPATVYFMTNAGYNFTGAVFDAVWSPVDNRTTYLNYDGLCISAIPIASYRFTMNAY